MDFLLEPIIQLLETYTASAKSALSGDDFGDQLTIVSAALMVCFLSLAGTSAAFRLVWSRFSRHDEKLHEKLRYAERRLESAQDEMAAVRKRNDQLAAYDPKRFLEEMDRVDRDSVFAHLVTTPENWLKPLRPALARAYRSMAREKLLTAESMLDVDEARHCAWGALAAIPEEEDHHTLLEEVAEIDEFLSMRHMSEEQVATLRLARMERDPSALAKASETMIENGKYQIAHLFARRAHASVVTRLGPEAEMALKTERLIADATLHLGRSVESAQLLEDVYQRARSMEAFGPRHPFTLSTMNSLAVTLTHTGRDVQAERLLREAIAVYKDLGSAYESELATSMDNLAYSLVSLQRYTDAESFHRSALAIRQRLHGGDHYYVAVSKSNLARVLILRNQRAEAEALARESLEIRVRALGSQHPETAAGYLRLGHILAELGQNEEAASQYKEALEISAASLGEDHPTTTKIRETLASMRDPSGKLQFDAIQVDAE